jgi:type IV pilus assembly protein PilO
MRFDKGSLLAAWRINRWLPLLLLVWLLFNVGIYFWLSQVFSPHVEEQERQLLRQQNGQRQSGNVGADALRPIRDDLQTFRQAIPGKSGLTALVQEVFSLATEAGLDIARVSYQPKELAEHGLLHYGLSFTVAGDYGQLKKFIFALEQSPRLLVIEEISLSGADGTTVNLNIRLLTYFRADLS